jgi:hypothetical protein
MHYANAPSPLPERAFQHPCDSSNPALYARCRIASTTALRPSDDSDVLGGAGGRSVRAGVVGGVGRVFRGASAEAAGASVGCRHAGVAKSVAATSASRTIRWILESAWKGYGRVAPNGDAAYDDAEARAMQGRVIARAAAGRSRGIRPSGHLVR